MLVEKAIRHIRANLRDQPSLDELAKVVGLSTFHFQRLFAEWAGVSPKKFIQFTSLGYAKTLLRESEISLLQASHELGVSGTGRLHDLFINIEAMTPGEYKKGGEGLNIDYDLYESAFGKVLIASTQKGICHIAFFSDAQSARQELEDNFPKAKLNKNKIEIHTNALRFINNTEELKGKLNLHIAGTPFQLKVWHALLSIPDGTVKSYGGLAKLINKQGAARAVGSAVAKNPIAYLIPCHRVIRESGEFGGYRWGETRKSILLAWESKNRAL